MSRAFPELEQVKVHIDTATRERHLDRITASLRKPEKRRRRFRLMAVAIAVFLLLPVIALAAERAEPGDLLYPVRQLLHGEDVGEATTEPTVTPSLAPAVPADDRATQEPISSEPASTSQEASGRDVDDERPDAERTDSGEGGTTRESTDQEGRAVDTEPERPPSTSVPTDEQRDGSGPRDGR